MALQSDSMAENMPAVTDDVAAAADTTDAELPAPKRRKATSIKSVKIRAEKTDSKKATTKKKSTKKKSSTKKKKKKKPTTKKKKKKKVTETKKRKRLTPKKSIILNPKSSWISFLSSIRAQNLPEHQSLEFGQLCRILSGKWKSMTDDEKAPFQNMYRVDRARYQRELAALSDDQKKILKMHRRRRRASRKGKPDLHLSSYMLFTSHVRQKIVIDNPECDFMAVGRLLGAAWRQLTEVDKQVYHDMASRDRERYVSELAVYNTSRAAERLAAAQASAAAKEKNNNVVAVEAVVVE